MNAISAHATALRLAEKHGIPVTFTSVTLGSENAEGHRISGASTSVVGFLSQDDNSQPSEEFEKLKLTLKTAERFQFVPLTLNAMPPENSRALMPHGTRALNSSDPYRMGANADAPYAWVVLV